MTGILLIAVTLAWLLIVIWLSKTIGKKLPLTWLRLLVGLLVFAVLLPLPLIDEIVGGRQFERLCKENSTIQVDRATAAGKTVYFAPEPPIEIKDAWLRIVLQPHRFVDAVTGVSVLGYNTLTAEGGRFIHALRISEGDMPLTFRGSCGPKENTKELVKSLGIVALDRPRQNLGGN